MITDTKNNSLQDSFSAVYYESIPPSLIAAKTQELGYLLFGEKGLKHFEAAQNGHFSYQDPDGFAPPFLRVPNNEAEVMAIWEKWAAKKNEQIERHFRKADYQIPPLFEGYLRLQKIEPVFAPLDNSSILTAQDSKYPQYWKLFFQIELPALALKRDSKLWEQLTQQETSEEQRDLSDYLRILRPEAIASILRLTQQSAVQQESVTVYIGKKQEIIRMDYLHLPILNRKTTDLLVPVNLQTESIFRETHSGIQQHSRTETNALAGISMLYRRHSQTQELTPFWNGGGMASRRGGENQDISLSKHYMSYGFSHQTRDEDGWTIEETSLKIFFTDGTSLKSKSKAQLKDLIMSISGDFPNGEAEKIRQHISGIINGLGLQYATKVEQDSEGASHYTAKKPEEIEKLIELEILRTLIATKIVAGLPTIWNTIDEIKRVKYELLVEYELICNQNYDLIKNTEKRYYYDTAKIVEANSSVFTMNKYICMVWLEHDLDENKESSWGGTNLNVHFPKGYFSIVVFLNPNKNDSYPLIQFAQIINILTLGCCIRPWSQMIRTLAHELFIHVCKDAHIWDAKCTENAQWLKAKKTRDWLIANKQKHERMLEAAKTEIDDVDNPGHLITNPILFVQNNLATTWENEEERNYLLRHCPLDVVHLARQFYKEIRQTMLEYICLFPLDSAQATVLSLNQRNAIIKNISTT